MPYSAIYFGLNFDGSWFRYGHVNRTWILEMYRSNKKFQICRKCRKNIIHRNIFESCHVNMLCYRPHHMMHKNLSRENVISPVTSECTKIWCTDEWLCVISCVITTILSIFFFFKYMISTPMYLTILYNLLYSRNKVNN